VSVQPFTFEEERFLLAQLSGNDDRTATKALQWLCGKMREGRFFTDVSRIRATTTLSLYRESHSAKRWAVNALTAMGGGASLDAVLGLLPLADSDPDLMAAIVAFVFSERPDVEASSLLGRHNVHMEGLALIAASQFSRTQKQRLIDTRIPLDTASPEELRAAIILAGTGKSPENLFHASHSNAIALSELNKHDVASVSKYSIWALTELRLGFSTLKIPISALTNYPPEVRKWFLRLLFSDNHALAKNLDLVDYARSDPSTEVREEAAMELRGTYIEGLSAPVTKWFFNEEYKEARFVLLEHMAAQSGRDTTYERIAMEFYKRELPKSDSRTRIEAAAAGTPLYRDLRKFAIMEEGTSLFSNDNEFVGSIPMTQINQTFNNSQIGAVSGAGGVTAQSINAVHKVEDTSARDVLLRSLNLIAQFSNNDLRANGEEIVQEVAGTPAAGKWAKLLEYFKSAKESVDTAGGLAGGINDLIGNISDLAGIG
jgi:hypothetical protein